VTVIYIFSEHNNKMLKLLNLYHYSNSIFLANVNPVSAAEPKFWFAHVLP